MHEVLLPYLMSENGKRTEDALTWTRNYYGWMQGLEYQDESVGPAAIQIRKTDNIESESITSAFVEPRK